MNPGRKERCRADFVRFEVCGVSSNSVKSRGPLNREVRALLLCGQKNFKLNFLPYPEYY
jgi:hypothetical protein